MKLNTREVAKFLSGIAAHETVGHWWLGTLGRHLLPWKFEWFTWTPTLNYGAMVLWPIVLAGLIYYAWGRSSRAAGAT